MTQDDVLFPQLTVEETLVFAAYLRLPGNMTRQQKYSRADAIMRDLSLERLVIASYTDIKYNDQHNFLQKHRRTFRCCRQFKN